MNDVLLKYFEIAKDYNKKANSLWSKVNFINVAEVLNNETNLSELSKLPWKIQQEAYLKKTELGNYADSLSEQERDLMYDEISDVENLFYLVDSKFGIIDDIIYDLNKVAEKSEEKEYLKKFGDSTPLNISESNKNNNMKTNKILSESIRDKEPFEKIIFNIDLSTSDASDRLFLARTIKEFKGEGLKKSQDGVWYTFIPVMDVDKFSEKVGQFSPKSTGEIQDFTKFKMNKGLKNNQQITFLDYSISETDPPLTVGYLKPGFIQSHKSLLKWTDADGNIKDEWIYNADVDIDGFYHRDPKEVVVKGPKIEFGVDTNTLTDREKEKLKTIVKAHGGRIDRLFGKKGYQSAGGKNYAIFKSNFDFDNFYQDAAEFEPYYSEMEKGSMMAEEEVMMNEARKVIRDIFRKIFN
jgi:hypothetical protein